jgi:hypothetical protein
MIRKWIAVSLFLTAASWAQVQPAKQLLSAVPAARLAHIRRGINLSEWFAQVYDPKGYTKEHFESWTTALDIALIKSAGFDHVRLSVNPQPMMDAARRHDGSREYFGYLDAAVKMILDAGLAVEIDMHPDSDSKERLAKEDDFVERFADFWSMVAQHCASWDPDRVFFEILNEPEMRDAYRWYGVEAKWSRPFGGERPRIPSSPPARAGTTMTTWFFSSPCRCQCHLRFPFLRAAHLYASGCNLGSVLLALAEGTPLSVFARECGAGGGGSSRGARSYSGDPLRTGSLGCVAHRSGNQSGGRLG